MRVALAEVAAVPRRDPPPAALERDAQVASDAVGSAMDAAHARQARQLLAAARRAPYGGSAAGWRRRRRAPPAPALPIPIPAASGAPPPPGHRYPLPPSDSRSRT